MAGIDAAAVSGTIEGDFEVHLTVGWDACVDLDRRSTDSGSSGGMDRVKVQVSGPTASRNGEIA